MINFFSEFIVSFENSENKQPLLYIIIITFKDSKNRAFCFIRFVFNNS